MTVRRVWVRRGLQTLTILLVVWAGIVTITGGLVVRVSGLTLTSHDVWRPLALALVCLVVSALLPAADRRRTLGADARWWTGVFLAIVLSPWHAWRALRLDLAIVATVAGSAFIVWQWLRARPLWLDEQMIAINIRDRGLADLAGELWLGQSAPLGWLVLQRSTLVAFGTGELALRAVPVAFAVGMLGLGCWAGRKWMSVLGATTLVVLLSLGTWVAHYSLELKHYSADLFFGLALPVLVVWALEAATSEARRRRATAWWLVAAVGAWLSNGAMLVAPASAAVLVFETWRRDGAPALARMAAPAALCGLAVGLLYVVSIRFTLGSDYLQDYWAFGLPPPDAGAVDTIRWLGGQFEPIADKPGGTTLGLFFWLSVVAGWLLVRSRRLAAVLILVAMSPFMLAAVRQVPLFERLSLWVVPALYVSLALAVDAVGRWFGRPDRPAHVTSGVMAVAVSLAGLWVAVDIVRHGWREFEIGRPADSNHQLDDRAGVRWLMAQSRPGDVLLTTELALPAVLWYGDGVLADLKAPLHASGLPILEVGYHSPGADCPDDSLERELAGHRRALVYLGFRFDDVPDEFDALLLDHLQRLGAIEDFRQFAGVTRAVIVDLDGRSPAPDGGQASAAADAASCVVAARATRW